MRRLPSLSPSRAADFKTCPLLYRFRSIDRIPEQPSADQARGTLVHAVLEKLFDHACGRAHRGDGRRAGRAAVGAAGRPSSPSWPGCSPRAKATSRPEFLASATRRCSAATSAWRIRAGSSRPSAKRSSRRPIDDQLLIRGYVDRLDISPAGDLRVVDYKTGGAPREAFEARALFQLKFYALVLWRTRGVVPRVLRLLYLKDAEICDYTPDAEELIRFERTLLALWKAIEAATAAQDFRPKPSKLCDWCGHQVRCPAFGGELPPFPQQLTVATADSRQLRLDGVQQPDRGLRGRVVACLRAPPLMAPADAAHAAGGPRWRADAALAAGVLAVEVMMWVVGPGRVVCRPRARGCRSGSR